MHSNHTLVPARLRTLEAQLLAVRGAIVVLAVARLHPLRAPAPVVAHAAHAARLAAAVARAVAVAGLLAHGGPPQAQAGAKGAGAASRSRG